MTAIERYRATYGITQRILDWDQSPARLIATVATREDADAIVAALNHHSGAVKAGWTLNDAIVTELRRSNDEPDPQALWQAVEA